MQSGCLRSWSGAPRGSRPAGRSRRRPAASPWRRTAACRESAPPAAARTARSSRPAARVQAVTPASASDAPISFRNVRRATGSVIASICDGNSLYEMLLESGVGQLLQARQNLAASSRQRSARRAQPDLDEFCAHRWHVEQLVEFLNLIFARRAAGRARAGSAGGFVVDAEDRRARPDVALRIAVAVEAPFHLQRLLLPHQRHPVDPAVARRAADALVHVDAVVEVDEVGQIVDARPLRSSVRCGSCRAPARGTGCSRRSANGSSCRSWSAGCRRTTTPRPRCGSSGSRCRCRRRGARG